MEIINLKIIKLITYMFLIKEKSYDSENPIYMKLTTDNNLMFIPEARVAKDYFNTGFYERGYINWACENFVDPNKNIIDIGAHIGWYTIDFSNKCNHVYSFECSPKSFNYLCANIALNNVDYKVTKYNCALSDNDGVAKYYIRDPKDGGGNGISKFEYDNINNTPFIEVPKKTLDSFKITNVNFIKIDVEGMELEVIEGALDTINRCSPMLIFEAWNLDWFAEERIKLMKFVESLGYSLTAVADDFVAVKN